MIHSTRGVDPSLFVGSDPIFVKRERSDPDPYFEKGADQDSV